jgi:hypothetical protein
MTIGPAESIQYCMVTTTKGRVRAAWPLTMRLPDTYIGARVGIRVK